MNTGADINVIAADLTELLQNSVNMASVFYDIFLNPEPQYVRLTQLGPDGRAVIDPTSGDPVSILIPNRAMDKILATVGTGSPEGRVEAGEGRLYVDEVTRVCYVKTTGTGSTGWQIILTEQGVYTYIDNYLRESGVLTEETLAEYLEGHRYTTESDVANIVANSSGVRYITTLPSSGSIILDDNKVYKITIAGDVSFELPQVSDLTSTHRIFIQADLTSADYEITLNSLYFFDNITPVFDTIGMYDIVYEYDVQRGVWVCGVTSKGPGSAVSLVQLKEQVEEIQALIPDTATSENQLADQDFVNSSIATNTANFIGTFNSLAELEAYSGTLTNNDYAFVIDNNNYNRYKYNAVEQEWIFEYTLNNSSFTAAQWAAINSGITAALVAQISAGGGVDATYDASTETIAFARASDRTVATFNDVTAGTVNTVSNLMINRMTSAEYATIIPSTTELYVLTDVPPSGTNP